MRIIDNRALALRVRHPSHITQVIPKSKIVGDHEVIVHWGLEECQILKNLGIKNVPSPIEAKYDWPGLYTPFDHQRTTASFLTLHRRAHCFNEMGLGKTVSVGWAADYLMTLGLIKRVLIVAPLSILDVAWQADLFKVCMHRTVDIAHGSADKRRKVINGSAEFIIINYDGIGTVHEELINGGFDLIVCDEASALKNCQTNRWKNVNALLKSNTWLWLLTGTPAAQTPTDAYGLAKLVSPEKVPRFFGAFRDRVMQKVTQFKYVPRPEAKAIVHEVLQPAIRFTKAECLDLPEMVYTRRSVPMTKQQEHYYKKMKEKFRIEASGEEVTSANAAIKLNKLLQIAGGATYTDSGEALEFDIKPRYKVLQEIIAETDQKVLVFVPYRHGIQLLTQKLSDDGITNGVIDGSVSSTARGDLFRSFQDKDDPRVLIIQPQAAAHGVTLTAASTVVWWGPVSSLETYAQANARVHRPGQKHRCTVVQIEGSDVERHIYAMLDNRIDFHTKIVDLYKRLLD